MRLPCLLLLCVASTFALEERFLFFTSDHRLGHYNVDKSKISVSGISSGAAFATQFHVIYSSHVMGAGLIAGVPFACSGGVAATAIGVCMKTPSLVSATALASLTLSGEPVGNVDATSNMANDRVYIFNGKNDTVVNPGIGAVIQQYYSKFIHDPQNIKTVFNVPAEHGQPTENYGGPCGRLDTPDYLNNCQYSAAYELLNHIYGGNLQLLKFDQSEFFYISLPATYAMATDGYVYVPQACLDKSISCKLHIAFHGCMMASDKIQDAYVRHAGYNEVGELNNIIILYPQTTTTLTNPNDCWDWFGYTGPLFATNKGFQETAVKRMMDHLTG